MKSKKKVSRGEVSLNNKSLNMVKKSAGIIQDVQKRFVENNMATKNIKELYRHLKSIGAENTANRVLIHTENAVREITELAHTLREAEVILLERAQYYERTEKTTSR